MADQPLVRVDGARELRRSMRRAGEDLGDLRAANREVAAIASTATVVAAPRRTGRLAASVRPGATQTQAIVRAGGAAVPYAQAIHWGWPRRGIAAQPFAAVAAAATEPTWTAVYLTAVERILQRIEGS